MARAAGRAVVLAALINAVMGVGEGLLGRLEMARERWLWAEEEDVLLGAQVGLAQRGALFHAPASSAREQLAAVADAVAAAATLRQTLSNPVGGAAQPRKALPRPLLMALVLEYEVPELPQEARELFDRVYVSPAGGLAAVAGPRVARIAALLSAPFEQTLFVSSSVRFCVAPHEIMSAFIWADMVAAVDYRAIDALDGGLQIHPALFGFQRNHQVRAALLDVAHELLSQHQQQQQRPEHSEQEIAAQVSSAAEEDAEMSRTFGAVLERYDAHPDLRVHVMLSRFHLQVCERDVSQCWINGQAVALSGALWHDVDAAACAFINQVSSARLIQPAAQHPAAARRRRQPARVWRLEVSSAGVTLVEQPDEELAAVTQQQPSLSAAAGVVAQ